MNVPIGERISGSSLVSKELFDWLVARIVEKRNLEPALAERIADQALALLVARHETNAFVELRRMRPSSRD